MRQFKFNWSLPRQFKDKNENINYALPRGNEAMNVGTFEEMQKYSDQSKPKNAQPWGQVFSNGFRVVTDSLDYKDWSGITFSDVDSKWFYDYCKKFDTEKLLKGLFHNAVELYPTNFYAIHMTNSKKGYRIFWYWDCEKTEDNFIKCCILTESYTKDLFYSIGDHGKQIIDYEFNGRKVLDSCSKSIMQGFYMTLNDILYNDLSEVDDFGATSLEDISISQIYESSMKYYSTKRDCKLLKITEPENKENIEYYPHHLRRCIYEALIEVFKEKNIVDNEWKRICGYLPEGSGHNKSFYENEPSKNKWFDRFASNSWHSVKWLAPFGYETKDNSEYIYIKQFKKSWKKHCVNQVWSLYIDELCESLVGKEKQAKREELLGSLMQGKYGSCEDTYDVFSKFWNISLKNENLERLDVIRNTYHKDRWKPEDFKHLCNGYEIAKDIVTYKMYADFYYRDENNLPLIKYNILEDEVLTYGYWPETNKKQWHPFKYGNEYTHWKNSDTFSNKCSKTDLLEAINKYVPRWYSFHSIKDYLNSLDLTQANEELLETWAIRYFNADDTKLTRTISKNFFIAAVKKLMIEDPTKFVFQHMLFLQGPTGCGKTTFLVTMFTIDGHSYILNKIDPDKNDNEIGPLIAKNWLIQFGESENLKKVSVNAQKEFIDRINLGMKYQKKYENEQTTIYPRVVACRTSNDDKLFNDISVDVDRRNWLIECKVPEGHWNDELQKKLEVEKDILWATALKLYIDNPDITLELPNDLFLELGRIQDQYKLITKNDIEEIYNDIFEREYLTNSKGEILDEYSFARQVERSPEIINAMSIDESSLFVLQENICGYSIKHKIAKIPANWLSNIIKKRYGISTMKLLKDYMIRNGWVYKVAGYANATKKCFVKQ